MGLIVDPGGRYVLTRSATGSWLQHDRRWRRSSPFRDPDVEVKAGAPGYFRTAKFTSEAISCSVCATSKAKDLPLSNGTFANGSWQFSGDVQAWANVSEYLLFPQVDGRAHLLRIADGAEIDPLEGLGVIERVVEIPESRLLVLAGEGHLTCAPMHPHTRCHPRESGDPCFLCRHCKRRFPLSRE